MPDLHHIAESLREPVGRFTERIKGLAGDNVLGWTLHGAGLSDHAHRAGHTVHSVLLLRGVDLDLLRRLAAEGPEFARLQFAAPLIMTPPFLAASRDTFPLELIDIQQHYTVVFGEDYFAGLTFEERDVRLQCERELKVIATGLRQGMLSASGKEEHLAALARHWSHALRRTLHGMLWLKGQKGRQTTDGMLDAIAKLVNLPLAGIRQVLVEHESPDWTAFKNFYADIEALGNSVDGW